jgi:hypothetical protein
MSEESIKDEYARFKAEYPNVYARLLENNRALGALQRAVTNLQNGKHAGTTGGDAFITSGDEGPFLELD